MTFTVGITLVLSFFVTTLVKGLSIGQSVQSARTEAELLDVAKTLWLPTDDSLAPHLVHQKLHHDKRQRWSAQLLDKIPTVADLSSPALTRAILAASIPFNDDSSTDVVDLEGQSILMTLQGIHRLLGKSYRSGSSLSEDALDGVLQLIDRAEALGNEFELADAVAARWACRGILRRVDGKVDIPKLDSRARSLPFDIYPLGVYFSHEIVDKLYASIPFQTDTIITRTGASVAERRATAWLAEDGIGALAYSGKLMPPKTLAPVVQDVMRQVETVLGIDDQSPYFDCALCNYYPDSDAACKFHTDPEHGRMWERLTCVVSFGDPRRFAFRPTSTWDGCEHDRPAVIDLFPGDIVRMDGCCNDDYLHAVYSARDDDNSKGRISLVLKRAIVQFGGRRGHGLHGQGRRSKRRRT